MGHRKKMYDTDFSSLSDMVLYAYGRERKIKSQKDVERLLFVIKERIAEYKIEIFRKNHNCKECYLFNNEECRANGYCRFDKRRRLVHKSRINGCPHNNNEPCCYANESGTCFGYCYKNQKTVEAKAEKKVSERSEGQ